MASGLKTLLRHARMPAVFMTLTYLALLTIADSVVTSKVHRELDAAQAHQTWGWALTVVSTISDITGQLLTGAVCDSRRRRLAMLINTTSMLLSTVLIFPQLLGEALWPFQVSVISPLLRLAGGGVHTSIYLALVSLNSDSRGSIRIALFWASGGVTHLAQFAGQALAARLSARSTTTSCLVGLAFVLAAYVTIGHCHISEETGMLSLAREEDEDLEEHKGPFARLVPTNNRDSKTHPWYALVQSRTLTITAVAMCLAGMGKAATGMFGAYVTDRYDFSSPQVNKLDRLRLVVALTVYGMVLPCVLFTRKFWSSREARDISFLAAVVGAVFLSLGSLGIGLALDQTALLAALTLDTLGVAMDLSLLAFAATSMEWSIAGRLFMIIATFESVGSLAGAAMMRPLYQTSLKFPGYAGGLIYYVGAAIYLLVLVLVSLTKLRGSSGRSVRLGGE